MWLRRRKHIVAGQAIGFCNALTNARFSASGLFLYNQPKPSIFGLYQVEHKRNYRFTFSHVFSEILTITFTQDVRLRRLSSASSFHRKCQQDGGSYSSQRLCVLGYKNEINWNKEPCQTASEIYISFPTSRLTRRDVV